MHDKDWAPKGNFTLGADMTFAYERVHLNVVIFSKWASL